MLAADLSSVHAVYLFPMSRGMDQYLANKLTNDHVFRVVTDPKLADAFFSDRVGEAFQSQVDIALKPPPKEEPKSAGTTRSGTSSMFSDPVNKLDNPSLSSSFGRGQGNVFLVDAKSRQVVWSTYDPPRDDTNKQLDRAASDIVNRIKKDLNPEKEKK
jgi:hypothetical protein